MSLFLFITIIQCIFAILMSLGHYTWHPLYSLSYLILLPVFFYLILIIQVFRSIVLKIKKRIFLTLEQKIQLLSLLQFLIIVFIIPFTPLKHTHFPKFHKSDLQSHLAYPVGEIDSLQVGDHKLYWQMLQGTMSFSSYKMILGCYNSYEFLMDEIRYGEFDIYPQYIGNKLIISIPKLSNKTDSSYVKHWISDKTDICGIEITYTE